MDGKGMQGGQIGRKRPGIEWPTVALAVLIYGGFGVLTYTHAAMPVWIFAPLCAWLVAWHGSMQHEILHGHPTRSRAINRAIAIVPISLWLPYETYRQSHLRHHYDDRLTDPLDDPESRYLTEADWRQLSRPARLLLRLQKTLAGRLVIGPAWAVSHFFADEAVKLVRGDRTAIRAWTEHAVGVAVVSYWLVAICGIDPLFYALAVVYPAISLLLIRSFAEHKAADGVAERTAVVENAWLFGPLFLFNNLHAAHHERPTMPWYEIPAWYRENRARLLRENGDHVYNGYGEVARRFLFNDHDSVVHPAGSRDDLVTSPR